MKKHHRPFRRTLKNYYTSKLEVILIINLPNGDIDEARIIANNMNMLKIRSAETVNDLVSELKKTFPFVLTTPEALREMIMVKKAPDGFKLEFTCPRQQEIETKEKTILAVGRLQ